MKDWISFSKFSLVAFLAWYLLVLNFWTQNSFNWASNKCHQPESVSLGSWSWSFSTTDLCFSEFILVVHDHWTLLKEIKRFVRMYRGMQRMRSMKTSGSSIFKYMSMAQFKRKASNSWSAVEDTYLSAKVNSILSHLTIPFYILMYIQWVIWKLKKITFSTYYRLMKVFLCFI